MSTGTIEAALVNGEPARDITVLDRGLHYGDGLFETLACAAGRPRLLALHLDRLAHGCARLKIPAPANELLSREIEQLAQGKDRSIVKVIVTRGAGGRGYAPADAAEPSRVLLRYPWPQEDPDCAAQGVRVRTAALKLGENPHLAGLKHCNRLEQVLARMECAAAGLPECLLFSSSGLLISGSMSNVFLVAGRRLRTPRLDRCGVAGVMRALVLQEAQVLGLAPEECELQVADLERAEELFLTNVRIGLWPVRELDERPRTVGTVTRRLQQHLATLTGHGLHA